MMEIDTKFARGEERATFSQEAARPGAAYFCPVLVVVESAAISAYRALPAK
jgi:hypothetical protein